MPTAHPHASTSGPSPWVRRFAPLATPGGEVLDLACGGGRHARLFLERGHPVTALDIDISGVIDLADDPQASIVEADLEDGGPWPLGGRRFAAVVVVNYLYRPVFPHLIDAVAPGGLLIYDTFARGQERFGRPRNPDHLLRPDELWQAVAGRLTVLAFEQGEIDEPVPAVRQRLCAINGADGRLPSHVELG